MKNIKSSVYPLSRFSAAGLIMLSASTLAAPGPADISGVWGGELCGDSAPETSCGAFRLYLVQNKDRICGSYFGGRPDLSQVDEGEPRSVLGVLVGNTAVVSIGSGRSGAIYMATARKSGSTLHWQVAGTIKKPSSGDIDLIAHHQSMKRTRSSTAAKDFARVRQECRDEKSEDQTASSIPASDITSGSRAFEGDWSYRSDCDRGHYVTLYIKNEDGHLVGSWSDGTMVRGSQGQLRGRIDQDRLVIERCSDSDETGGPALCPAYQESQDYLVAKGDTLTWYQTFGSEPSEYVVLSKGMKPHRPMEACDEDQQGVEQ